VTLVVGAFLVVVSVLVLFSSVALPAERASARVHVATGFFIFGIALVILWVLGVRT
jgi:hypothetical protein